MNYYQRTVMYVRILIFMLALLLGLVVYGFVSYADERVANNYDELKNCIYNSMLNRESSVTVKYTGADYKTIYQSINVDKLINEIKYIDNNNTSDDGIYMIKAAYDGFSFKSKIDNNNVYFTYNFTWDESSSELKHVNDQVNNIINQTGVMNMNNAYDRAVALKDYVENNITYCKTSKNTPYTALTSKTATCHSFSLLYYKLLTAAKVECYYVTGNVDLGWHAWNIVKLGDKWYNVDLAYNREYKDNKYAFKGTSSFSSTHSYDAEFLTNEFLSKYNISQTDFNRNDYAGNDLIIIDSSNQQNNQINETQNNNNLKQNSNDIIKTTVDNTSTENNTVQNTDIKQEKSQVYDNSPKTGDVTPLTICIILAFISLVVCISIVVNKKR